MSMKYGSFYLNGLKCLDKYGIYITTFLGDIFHSKKFLLKVSTDMSYLLLTFSIVFIYFNIEI